jgi:multicomponent Na+:H+ antiporter subunit B
MDSLFRRLSLLGLLGGFCAVLIWVQGDLPDRGDPQAPANQHVSPEYLLRAKEETGGANVVTAILADYRSYDTLGELFVIMAAGLACVFVLRGPRSSP